MHLVTGASGNVGRAVVRSCDSLGMVTRRAVRADRDEPLDARAVAFDFEDRSTWRAALSGCAGVFLLRPPALSNMDDTLNPFVDAAVRAGVRHVVFLSVSGADKMPWVPHRSVELHLARAGVAWTLLRPGFFAQNIESAYRSDIVEDGRIYVPAGEGKVAFVDVLDIGAVAAHVLRAPHLFHQQTLTLTGPEAITFHEVAAILTKVLGRTIRYERASLLGYAAHLRTKRHLPWTQVAVQTVLHAGLRGGDAEVTTQTVAEVTGERATTFEDYAVRVAPDLASATRATGATRT